MELTENYKGLSVLQEAKKRKANGMGYRARRFKILWQNKECRWNWFAIEWGIRWSDKIQIFPIWNVSNNSQRALLFGVWKFYFEVIYYRKDSFNQDRRLPFTRKLNKFYRLLF